MRTPPLTRSVPSFSAVSGADLDAMTAALAGTAWRLHGVATRTDGARIAAEVLRLNDAVRAAVAPHLPCTDPPGAYLQALVALADASNGGPA